MSGSETDIDCGGAACPACPEGLSCLVDDDCLDGYCVVDVCGLPPASCGDGTQNDGETGLDCGGLVCSPCPNSEGCIDNADCQSGYCDVGVCATCVNTSTLAWDAPVAQDGSCVMDLAGYRIFYGPNPGLYTDAIDVPLTDGGLTCADTGVPNPLGCGNVITCEYVLANLPPGPTYFVATAYNSSGDESTYSNEASKHVDCE
jgi:hypothetical protein